MNLYNIADLHRYYLNSWIVHPTTGIPHKCMGQCTEQPNHLYLQSKGKGVSIDINSLEWEHVKCPELGYRTDPSGHYVWHAQRRAIRHTSKGFNSTAVSFTIPAACKEYWYELDGTTLTVKTITDAIADSVYNPTYITLGDAVRRLQEDPKATGFALSASWAVTIGMLEGAEYQLHLRGIHVAVSPDGVHWNFLDDAAQRLFEMSSVR